MPLSGTFCKERCFQLCKYWLDKKMPADGAQEYAVMLLYTLNGFYVH